MTAIALIGGEREYYIITDSMLSMKVSGDQKIDPLWVPTRGFIDFPIGGNNSRSIKRFGRKTNNLPYKKGIYAWSGSLYQAKIFAEFLYEKIESLEYYQPGSDLTKEHLDEIFFQSKRECLAARTTPSMSVVGLIRQHGIYEPFVLGSVHKHSSEKFGNCLISGSGSSILTEMIKQAEDVLQIDNKEALCNYIAAEMLLEEHRSNGNTPFDVYCGGVWPWFSITSNEIHHFKPYLHIYLDTNYNLIRSYLFQPMRTEIDQDGSGSFLEIFSRLNKNTINKVCKNEKLIYEFNPEQSHSMIISSEVLSPTEKGGNISAELDETNAEILYTDPMEVKSLFLCIFDGNRTVKRYYILNEEGFSRFYFRAGKMILEIRNPD